MASVARSLLVCAVLFAGCGESTHELFVDVRSDLVPGVEFDEIRAELRDERGRMGEVLRTADEGVAASHDYVGGRRVAEWADLEPGSYVVRLDLRLGTSPVADVLAAVELSGDRAVTITVSADCAGVTCPTFGDEPSATSCLYGQCAPPRCLTGGGADCPTMSDGGAMDGGTPDATVDAARDAIVDAEPTDASGDGGALLLHPSDLLVYFPFDDTDATDRGPLALGGVCEPDPSACGELVDGVVGSAWRFSTSHVRVPHDGRMDTELELTVLVWAKVRSLSPSLSVTMIAGIAYGAGTRNSWELYLNDWEGDGTRDVHWGLADTDLGDRASAPVTFATDEWVLFTGVFDGGQGRLYLDGEEVAVIDLGRGLRHDGHDLVIGGDENRGEVMSYWPGDIDELRIWRRVLTPAEILAIHAAEQP